MDARDAADGGLIDRGTLPSPLPGQGTWIGDEITRAQARLEALHREILNLQLGMRHQQEEGARVAEMLQLLDGRTQRHEAGQEIAREVRQAIAEVEQRVTAEATLRRDLARQLERAERREAETRQELQRVLDQIGSRLDEVGVREEAVTARQHSILEEVTDQDRGTRDMASLLDALVRRLAAIEEQVRHQGVEVAHVVSTLVPLATGLDAMDARFTNLQTDARRIEDDMATLRAIRGREETLLEVVEQQRVTRARLEERLNAMDEAMEAARQAQAELRERVALLGREQAGDAEQRRTILERLESQRDVVLDHLRRQLRTAEDVARRRIDEIDHEIRVSRALLIRLDERQDDVGREQPL